MHIANNPGAGPATDPLTGSLPFDDPVLDVVPMGVCVLDADGTVLRYNRMANELCGGSLGSQGRLRIVGSDGALQALADTPLAYTIRTGRPALDVALSIERSDRDPAAVLANIEALRNDTGQITGAVVCFQSSTPARQLNADRRRNLDWLSAIVENTPECVKVVDRDGTLVEMNPAGLQMLEAKGHEEVQGGSVFDLVAPEHRAYWQKQHLRVCDGEKLSWEFDIISLAGNRRHMETHAVPMTLPNDSNGSRSGFVQLAITRDITERKVAENNRQLLLNELNHRVKNTLATVQSIAAQSFRRDTGNQSHRWFEGRLIALSKAHDVLSRENWQAADLREVIEQSIAPFRVTGRQRFVTEGPAQRLRPKQALALAMGLHELCTNAAKYGALSNDSGQVRIAWQVEPSNQTPTLRLHWEEVGGPVVTPPVSKGFGSRLLERGLGGELNAEVRLAYLTEGVVCDIEVPLQ